MVFVKSFLDYSMSEKLNRLHLQQYTVYNSTINNVRHF